jgi:mannose/cellobiose epimerase-like protein (N-acyl-D-glucosamine 2-epimerase family)
VTDLDRLLGFAARSRVADGFGYLGSDGEVLRDRPLETWIVARMTHVFGLAALLGRPEADELALHGVLALTSGALRDARHGGWHAATGDGAEATAKTAYVHAFVLLAGATATTARVPGGRELLADALEVWQHRFWDDAAGMAVEEWDAGWTTLSAYRGVNANMHGVEATLAAADALDVLRDPATAGRLRNQARRTVERVVHGWARQGDWRLPEHFTADWQPLPEFNRDRPADPFRPYGVTVGHQFEWSRLALHLRAVTDGAPSWLLDDARGLFDAAAQRGWAADGYDGFPYTLDWDDRPVVTARMHWVLTEAVAAAGVLAEVTGEPRYRDLADRWRAHGEEVFLDPATGNWHHELTADGEPASGTWDGEPDAYHLAQMLLLDGRPVRGSLAAALA